MALSGKRVTALVTGASGGIGRQCALQLAVTAAAQSRFILTGRSDDALQQTANQIRSLNKALTVDIVSCDLAQLHATKLDEFEGKIGEVLQPSDRFDVSLVCHNAGSLGDVTKRALQQDDGVQLQQYFALNLVSMIQLNSLWLNKVKEMHIGQNLVINISSLLAIEGFPSFSLYSAGKAARDAFMRVLATEEADVRVLNYAPGPVDTPMLRQIVDTSCDDAVRRSFREMQENGSVLKSHETVEKLIKILNENEFRSGAHVDYFDCS